MADLKSQNNLPVAAIIGVTIILALVIQLGIMQTKTWAEAVVNLGASVVLLPVLVLLSNVLTAAIKHKLVFLRVRNELPGHRCQSLCLSDKRLDAGLLKSMWPELFDSKMSPDQQNAFWYQKIYRLVKDEPEVLQAHRSFLLYRDAAAGVMLLLIIAIVLRVWGYQFGMPEISLFVPVSVGAMLICLILAAQISGKRMVVNAVVCGISR